MKADAHRKHAESFERTITLAQQDPETSVGIIENAWGAAYHWTCYGCIQKYQQHRDEDEGLAACLESLDEQELAQWWRDIEDLRQAGFFDNRTGANEVQGMLELLENIRTWATD